MTAPADPVILLDRVSMGFGTHPVLRDLTLPVRRGETLLIIGESGCGKTVLLKLLVGLLRPAAGRVLFEGRDLADRDAAELIQVRRRFGFLFQGAALFDSLTVYENVAYPLRALHSLKEAEIRERVRERLKEVGLPESAATRTPAELSGGMRKRVGIARAIVGRPKYILYDEPTTGLDPVTSAVIDQLMVRMQQQLGMTSIVITHDMRSAYTVGTRIAMLDNGRVRRVGTVDEIRHTDDPVVRQFIDGRATIDPAELGGEPA